MKDIQFPSRKEKAVVFPYLTTIDGFLILQGQLLSQPPPDARRYGALRRGVFRMLFLPLQANRQRGGNQHIPLFHYIPCGNQRGSPFRSNLQNHTVRRCNNITGRFLINDFDPFNRFRKSDGRICSVNPDAYPRNVRKILQKSIGDSLCIHTPFPDTGV